jgi:hypothetical protein
MKRLLTAAMIATFGLSIVGCQASGEIDDPDDDSSYKKTTTVDDDGSRTVRTEKKVDRD